MAKYYPLVNKVVGLLDLREKVKKAKQTIQETFTVPFITVAREPGSGGAPIAKALAEKLGYEYVDEQIVDAIARSTKRRRAIIKAVDEKSRSKMEDIVHSTLNLEYIDERTYVTELVKVIIAYACNGRTVILGRGANFVTPFASGLHVNIIAPYKVRVQRAMDFEGHSLARAKEVIAEVEKERSDFVKHYFRKNIQKRTTYDLTLNTQYFQVNEARDVIIEALYQKFSRSLNR